MVMERAVAGRLATDFDEWRHVCDCASVPVHVRQFIQTFSADSLRGISVALQILCGAVHDAVGRDPVVLLDDYDVPYLEAWREGYVDATVILMEALLAKTFKANRHLERGLVMGTVPIAFDDGWNDVWNAAECSILEDRYRDFFTQRRALVDFTEPDVCRKKWLRRLLGTDGAAFREDWERLFAGKRLVVEVEKQVLLSELPRSRRYYWSALMHCGLLQVVQTEAQGVCLDFTGETARRQCLSAIRFSGGASRSTL